jgi:hypothetical protein
MNQTKLECGFCKKQFTNSYTLSTHQKTALYCLDIQKQNNNTTKEELNKNKVYECEFCDKTFTLKSSLKTHYIHCKSKELKFELDKVNETHFLQIKILENKNKELEEENKHLSFKYRQFENKNKQMEEEINKLQSLNLVNEIENKNLKLIIERIEKENEEYKNRLFSREEKLTEEIAKRPTVINNNNKNTNTTTQQHIINYNNEFNKMFEELVPFTDEFIKDKIKEIKPSSLIFANSVETANSNLVYYNFACNIVNILKQSIFFTDSARGKLVYKDENNNAVRDNAEHFVKDSVVKKCKSEIIELCKSCLELVRQREADFTDKDYGHCTFGIVRLSECISSGKPHAIITEIANRLSKNVNSIPSVQQFKQLLKKSVETITAETPKVEELKQ